MAAVNKAWMDVSVTTPYMMSTIDGGIMVPKVPEAQTVPQASFDCTQDATSVGEHKP